MKWGHNRKRILEILEMQFPEEDFILAMGTSHTHGVCHRNSKDSNIRENMDKIRSSKMDEKYLWTSIASSKIGLPVVNVAVPGMTNNELLDLFLYAIKSEKFKKHCKMVICECRFMHDMIDVDFWNFISKNKGYDLTDQLKHLSESGRSDMTVEFLKSRKHDEWVHTGMMAHPFEPSQLPVVAKKNLSKYYSRAEKIIMDFNTSSFMKGSTLDPKFYGKKLLDAVGSTYDFYHQSMPHIKNDCRILDTMYHMCDILGIKFKWFVWSAYIFDPYFGTEENSNYTMNILSQQYMAFDNDIKNLRGGATYSYVLETGDLPEECDCGHQPESFHKWIANKIIEEIKGEI